MSAPHLVESITPLVRPTVRHSDDATNSSLYHRYVNPSPSYYFADHSFLSKPARYLRYYPRRTTRSSKSLSTSRTRITPATSAATILGTLATGTGITNSTRIVVTGRTLDIFLDIIAKRPENVPSEPVFERRATASTSRDYINNYNNDGRSRTGHKPNSRVYRRFLDKRTCPAAALGIPWRAATALRVTARDLW